MPEGSTVPYGEGIFLRSTWAVLQSVQSEFAFGAYCGELVATWPSDQRLVVHCELLEGEPRLPAPQVNGTAIEVNIQRKHSANPSLHPTASSVLRPLPSAGELKR